MKREKEQQSLHALIREKQRERKENVHDNKISRDDIMITINYNDVTNREKCREKSEENRTAHYSWPRGTNQLRRLGSSGTGVVTVVTQSLGYR